MNGVFNYTYTPDCAACGYPADRCDCLNYAQDSSGVWHVLETLHIEQNKPLTVTCGVCHDRIIPVVSVRLSVPPIATCQVEEKV